ncbi:hypothetical protein C6P45_003066 [Maudiozyma exigua]|uniref:RING-type domain-containing protein n=1 Tax=Maudiozyma exigua TaxID=34358 RepID=A0A9P6WHH1_MAUEX|nr:hypothetical protein C6P45_003066 [Kazachstania exigua]
MNGQLFEQSFVYCNICHRRHSNGDPLRLTSCAHILCSMHVNNDNICSVCSTHDISVIKLEADKNLPTDVTAFFEPLTNLLETVYNVSQFQQQALVNQIQYYQTHCVKLREKVARQQQLLYKAKQELDGVTQLKNHVANLEMQLRQANVNRKNSNNYRSQSQTISKFFDRKSSNKLSVTNFDTKSNTSLQPPMTVDLTMDDSSHEDGGNFLSKLKRTASLRNGIVTATNTTNTRQILPETNNYPINTYSGNPNNNVSRNGSIAVNDGIEAESTQLAKYTYSPNNGRSVTKDLTSMRVSSLSSLSSGSGSRGHSSLTYGSSHSNQTKDRNNNNSALNRNKFPQALDRLRIAKRNSTTNNEPIRTISNSQGIIAHMRSSGSNNNNRNTNSTFSSNRRSLTSQVTSGSKYTNSQTSTTKTRRK